MCFFRHDKIEIEINKFNSYIPLTHYVEEFLLDAEEIINDIENSCSLLNRENQRYELQIQNSTNQMTMLNTAATLMACAIAFSSYFTGTTTFFI